MGTRFGRLKQLEPVSPHDEAIMDLNIADARAAGFGRVVLIIRAELESAFRAHFERSAVDPVYVYQEIPDDRTAPWGTGEAVLCARIAVDGRFAVANADDLYGPDAFRRLAAVERDWAIVGYPVSATLSGAGGVSRAVCEIDDAGMLRGLREHYDLRMEGDAVAGRDGLGNAVRLPADAPVSMNLWGFDTRAFALLQEAFDDFRSRGAAGEFLLSDAVGAMVEAGRARVRVLHAAGGWAGITHPDDLSAVRAFVASRHGR